MKEEGWDWMLNAGLRSWAGNSLRHRIRQLKRRAYRIRVASPQRHSDHANNYVSRAYEDAAETLERHLRSLPGEKQS